MAAKPTNPLKQALDALHKKALHASSPWYVEPLWTHGHGRQLPPLALLRTQILESNANDRFWLSGHVGSGKSTEIRRFLADEEILEQFYVVLFDIDPTAFPSLTSHHLLFLIAAELYKQASNDTSLETFDKKEKWMGLLRRMDHALYGASGLVVQGGKFGLEFDLLFTKLKQELNVSDGRRIEFRQFAETQAGILIDLIDALVEDIEGALKAAETEKRVLVAIDDLEKLAKAEQFTEIFNTNLGAFLAPRLPILAVVPPSLTFDGSTGPLSKNIVHLRPAQVLKKTTVRDPMQALDRSGVEFLKKALAARVPAGVFEDKTVEEAAVYSGGVLWDFFQILRNAAIRAKTYKETRVTHETFGDTLIEETNSLARTLFAPEREILARVREEHRVSNASQLDYMRRSIILEYNHDDIWWEVTPLLWDWLARS